MHARMPTAGANPVPLIRHQSSVLSRLQRAPPLARGTPTLRTRTHAALRKPNSPVRSAWAPAC
jgi:hypothetical protein